MRLCVVALIISAASLMAAQAEMCSNAGTDFYLQGDSTGCSLAQKCFTDLCTCLSSSETTAKACLLGYKGDCDVRTNCVITAVKCVNSVAEDRNNNCAGESWSTSLHLSHLAFASTNAFMGTPMYKACIYTSCVYNNATFSNGDCTINATQLCVCTAPLKVEATLSLKNDWSAINTTAKKKAMKEALRTDLEAVFKAVICLANLVFPSRSRAASSEIKISFSVPAGTPGAEDAMTKVKTTTDWLVSTKSAFAAAGGAVWAIEISEVKSTTAAPGGSAASSVFGLGAIAAAATMVALSVLA
jgi:hypothetical protein